MKTVRTRKSWNVGGQARSTGHSLRIKDWELFKAGVKSSAEFLAETHGGRVDFQETEKSLYISYLDVPNTERIDQIYIVD